MKPAPLRIIIAGGGTGGHLFPGIAIARELTERDPDNRVLFVGSGKPLERAVLLNGKGRLDAEFDMAVINVEGLKRRGLGKQVRAVFRLFPALIQSLHIIRTFRPDLVMGVGGYSAGPVAVAAWLMSIPVVIHEQNMLPGVTNQLLSPLADRIYVSFDNTRISRKYRQRVRVLGNPVRREILRNGKGKREKGKGHKSPEFTVAVLGGSQGAHAINMAMMEAAEILKDRGIRLIHQTGEADVQFVAAAYANAGVSAEVRAFFRDMASVYAAADLIVCRAGATTVAEITALGKPAIFIPFPFAADDHQTLNAREPADAGAAELIPQAASTTALCRALADRILFYADHPQALDHKAERSHRFGRPEAARRIVLDMYKLAQT